MNRVQRIRRAVLTALFITALLVPAGTALALDPVFSTYLGGAIRGYDPVAYHTEGKPVAGKRAHRVEWKGATWSFASAENKAVFEGDPEKYAPRYGGYCAWAVSQGYTASIDPDAWSIVEGKLYLNYSLGVRDQWSQDIPGNIAKGNVNWPKLLAGK
jgi:YHS domain-containing protein